MEDDEFYSELNDIIAENFDEKIRFRVGACNPNSIDHGWIISPMIYIFQC